MMSLAHLHKQDAQWERFVERFVTKIHRGRWPEAEDRWERTVVEFLNISEMERRSPWQAASVGSTGMTPSHQISVPAPDGVRSDEQPQSAQDLAWQRGEEGGEKCPVLRGESHPDVRAELPFEDGDLVAQGENLDVLVSIAHGQQSQCGDGVRDGEIGQVRARVCLSWCGRNSRTPRGALTQP